MLDKKIVKPEPLEANATAAEVRSHKEKSELYRKANSYAKSMITSALTDAVNQKIVDKEAAYDAWEALKQQFVATSKDQIFKICSDFFAYSWSSDNGVSTHVANLKRLWNEMNTGLKAKGENELPDLILVCKTLHILPENFETFRQSWMLLTNDTEKTFDELTMQLCMFQRNHRKTDEEDNADTEAFAARMQQTGKKEQGLNKNSKSDTCNYCKKKGHWVGNCRK